MGYLRRLIATVIGCVAWCFAAATVAFAQLRRIVAIVIGCAALLVSAATVASAAMLHDPVPVGSVAVTRSTGAPLWGYVATTALGVLLAIAVVAEVSFAIVALVSSLRHSQRPGHGLHA